MRPFRTATPWIAGALVTVAFFLWSNGESNLPSRPSDGDPSVDLAQAQELLAEPESPETAPPTDDAPQPTIPTDRTRTAIAGPQGKLADSDAGAPSIATPLRVRLVERATGVPIPEFLVRVGGHRAEIKKSAAVENPDVSEPDVRFEPHGTPRRVEDIVTDAEGRLESSIGFEAGRLHLVLVDHPSFLEQAPPTPDDVVEHLHTLNGVNPSAERRIHIVIGPTYRLDVTLPAGTKVDDFYATFPRVLDGALRGLHGAIAEDPTSPMALFYGSAIRPEAAEQRAPLRAGDPIWARFRSPIESFERVEERKNEHELHVRSVDGHWSGKAFVTSIKGIYPDVVPVALTAKGAIEGSVQDAKGGGVPTAWIQLFALSSPSEPLGEIGADSKGRFAFLWLAAGEYEVRVQTDRYEEWVSRVSVVAGTTEKVEARPAASVPLGTVSGVLRSRTGQHRSKGNIVALKSLDDPDFFLFKSVGYRKRDGEYQGSFSFDEIPAGQYELSLRPLDNLRWNTLRMNVSPPVEGLEFICEDDVPTFDFGFRAIDAETGDPIEKSWSIVWQGNPLDNIRLEDDWETGLYEAVPEGVSLTWVLRAKGYRLARGDESDIRPGTDHRVIEARLVRGWGQVFKVTESEGDPGDPIAGVELLADGVSVGVTDARGMVSMDLDAKPSRLEFRFDGWHVSWGSVDPAEDGFGWGPEDPVYLSPNK